MPINTGFNGNEIFRADHTPYVASEAQFIRDIIAKTDTPKPALAPQP